METLLKEINDILKAKNQEIEYLNIRVKHLESEKAFLEKHIEEMEKQHGNVSRD